MFFKSKERKFWDWFAQHQQSFYDMDGVDEELFNQLSTQLADIEYGLAFAFSPIKENGKKELVISAEGIVERFPCIINLINKAPEITNWEITGFRQRIPSDDLEINLGPFSIGYQDIFFKYLLEDGKIGLQLHVRYFQQNDSFINAIFILLDALLGEYDVGTQIGFIEWETLDEKDVEELLPILMLRDLVDKKKAAEN